MLPRSAAGSSDAVPHRGVRSASRGALPRDADAADTGAPGPNGGTIARETNFSRNPSPMRPLDRPGRSPVHARRAMAATSHTAATQTALEILRAGGNALDAAIAACAVQCVVEPAMTGIGGDCFAMYAPGGRGTPLAFNGSGRAPAGATLEAVTAALAETGSTELARGSAHSVIVPGAVDAWTRLHADHGRLPFAELMAPAIEMAREGFPVASRVAFDIGREVDYLRGIERAAGMYLDASGRGPAVGSLHRLPELAHALEAIAREGRAAFYEGELAREMVAELGTRGGLHTMADFAGAAGEYVTPISSDFRGLAVHECPPNGQGLIALLLLNVMREVPPDPDGPLSPRRIHLEIEACRQAYRVRDVHLADPAHADVPVAEILDPGYARALLEAIDPERATVPTAIPRADTPPRHGLHQRGRRGTQRLQLHQHALPPVRRRHHHPSRHHPDQPRTGVLARSGEPQRHRPGQAPTPHDHPGDGIPRGIASHCASG